MFMLKTIILSNNDAYIQMLLGACEKSDKISTVKTFSNHLEALKCSKENIPDFALVDFESFEENCIELGIRLRDINPNIILMYITERSQITNEIFCIKADFCLIAPLTIDDITDAIERAYLLSRRNKNKIFARTFGRFDIFVNNESIYFPNRKSKELLALCIDKCGGEVTMEMAINTLWPEKEYDDKSKRLYRKAISALDKALGEAVKERIFEHSRGNCRICASKISCDYYDYLRKPNEINFDDEFEYMFQYSWAEETAAKIYFKQQNLRNK